ncbi:MAG TPA: IS1595 family transposase [Stellaceae bacterium]|jgi:transposase-like protein
MTNLTDPIFSDDAKAREHFAAIRWPNGPICSHCGTVDQATLVKGKSHRAGMYQCNACRQPFSVTTGTVMESSKIGLAKWALAFHLMAASKKGVSAHQLHRMLGITYKSAWFMAHRVREAMGGNDVGPMGGAGGYVEADETYIGRKPGRKKMRGSGHKMAVMSLVERHGAARSFHITDFDGKTLSDILDKHVSRTAHLRTDEYPTYKQYGHAFASHETVNHGKEEYVRGDASTNTIEGYFSIFKRGMHGVYQHCSEQHLQRYLNEFDFRYTNRAALGVDDLLRTMRAIKGAGGKRLTYVQSRSAKAAA